MKKEAFVFWKKNNLECSFYQAKKKKEKNITEQFF